MAKMCGEDTPSAIADWAKNHQEQILKLLRLERPKLPHCNTYRRILAHVVYEEEVARLVGEYNQRGEHGEVYAIDGKAPHGMRKKDEDGSEYLLSVYDVEQSQGDVPGGCRTQRKRDHEGSGSPEKRRNLSENHHGRRPAHPKSHSAQIIDQGGDYVFRSRKINSGCIKTFNNSLLPNIQNPDSEKSRWIFSPHKK